MSFRLFAKRPQRAPIPFEFRMPRTDAFLHRHFSGDTLDYRQILAIFLPILLDQAFLVSMNFLNTAMISSSGDAAVSAVNMVDSVNNFLISILISVSTGGTVVVAQCKGRGDLRRIPQSVGATIVTVLGLAALMSAVVLAFAEPIISLLFGVADPEVLNNARIYLMGSVASYCGIAVMEAVCGALRGIGETRSSLLLSVIMNGSYVVMNVILINGIRMGISGMAISVNVARYLAAVCAVVLVLKRKNPIFSRFGELVSVDKLLVKKVMKIGMPFASEQIFFNGGKILTQTFIVQMGLVAQTVNAISSSIFSLNMIFQSSMVLVIVTVVGQCVGNKDYVQIKKVMRSFLVTLSLISVVVGGLILLFFGPMVSLFSSTPEILPELYQIALMTTIGHATLWGISFLTPAALKAGGDAKFTTVVSMLSMWLFRVVLGYLFGIVFGLGVTGVWMAMVFEWGIRGTIFMVRFRGEKWTKV